MFIGHLYSGQYPADCISWNSSSDSLSQERSPFYSTAQKRKLRSRKVRCQVSPNQWRWQRQNVKQTGTRGKCRTSTWQLFRASLETYSLQLLLSTPLSLVLFPSRTTTEASDSQGISELSLLLLSLNSGNILLVSLFPSEYRSMLLIGKWEVSCKGQAKECWTLTSKGPYEGGASENLFKGHSDYQLSSSDQLLASLVSPCGGRDNVPHTRHLKSGSTMSD